MLAPQVSIATIAAAGPWALGSSRLQSGTLLWLLSVHARLVVVEMRPVDFTNDTHVIRSFATMTAINSAIEVDTSGQVVADSIGDRLYSGVGGQMDFIRGAALAERGRAIIALPSTAGDGSISRIVTHLRPGAGVVTTRAHVRTVVTEYGVAELFGRSIRERSEALIAIAHPDHRDALRFEARRSISG